MQFVIKNPAPRGDDVHRWGDEYFGRALEDALVEAGCTVRQDFWPDWDQGREDAVVLVLRGARRWLPPKGGFRILWIISHPTAVSNDELDHYDLVLAASRVHARLLASRTRTPVRAALQCTDERVFHPPQTSITRQIAEREGIVYVANTRGIRRDMGQWLLESGREARLFGRAWEYCGLGHMVEAQHLPNPEVAELYRHARIALNDHWLDMRGLGYINNRLFDCLACGVPVISDESPELRAVFGDAVLYADSGEALDAAVRACESDYGAILQRVDEARQRLAGEFTFRARARELMEWAERPPDASKPRLGRGALALEPRLEALLRTNITQHEQGATLLQKGVREQELALDKANKRLEKAEREREAAVQSLTQAQHERDRAAHERDMAIREQERSHQRALAAEAELEKGQAVVEQAREQMQLAAVLLRHSERVERFLQELLTSTSWRITAPLRWATGLLRLVVRGRRGVPLRYIPKRPPEMDRLRELLGMESAREAMSRPSPASGQTPLPQGSLRSRLVPLTRKVLRVAKRTTQELRDRQTGTGASGTKRSGNGGHTPDPAPASAAQSEEAAYWRLQAYQLLEELEYLRADPPATAVGGGSSNKQQTRPSRQDTADSADSAGR